MSISDSAWFGNDNPNKRRAGFYAEFPSHPVLHFLPFLTEHSWATDPFALFQNGIRHEIEELYRIVRSLAIHIDYVKVTQFISLQKWLVEFSQVVSLYFLVQERILYPAILTSPKILKEPLEHLQDSTQEMLSTLIAIHGEALVLVTTCRDQDHERESSRTRDRDAMCKSMLKLSQFVSGFVSQLEKLFSWEVKTLAPIIQKRFARKEAKTLEGKCFKEIVSYDVGENIFGAYSKWVPVPVRSQYLSGVDALKMRRLRFKERKWFRTHKFEHSQLA